MPCTVRQTAPPERMLQSMACFTSARNRLRTTIQAAGKSVQPLRMKKRSSCPAASGAASRAGPERDSAR